MVMAAGTSVLLLWAPQEFTPDWLLHQIHRYCELYAAGRPMTWPSAIFLNQLGDVESTFAELAAYTEAEMLGALLNARPTVIADSQSAIRLVDRYARDYVMDPARPPTFFSTTKTLLIFGSGIAAPEAPDESKCSSI